MNQPSIRFVDKNKSDFQLALRKRVNQYFKKNGISKQANTQMVIKTIFVFLLYTVPYGLIVSNMFSVPMMILLFFIMGFGLAGIGLCIMHDANHGAYSKKDWVNRFMGGMINFVGGNAATWKMQHNVLHHTYTNIDGMDDDIDAPGIMSFSPHDDPKSIRKGQFIYAWFLYGLMTLTWVLHKDWVQFYKYKKRGLFKIIKANPTAEFFKLLGWRLFYYFYIAVIPIMFTDLLWYQWLGGFFLMHFTAGLILGMVFQPAHVVENLSFPLPNKDGVIEMSFAEHQMRTTSNFGINNKLLTWCLGGLNYQVEHHLFPNVCHVHYPKLSKIVRETAEEYNIPYNAFPTFGSAIAAHARALRKLGDKPELKGATL